MQDPVNEGLLGHLPVFYVSLLFVQLVSLIYQVRGYASHISLLVLLLQLVISNLIYAKALGGKIEVI